MACAGDGRGGVVVKVPPSTTGLEDARRRLQSRLEKGVSDEKLDELIDAALSIHKRVSVEIVCRGCSKRQMHWVEIPDAKSAVQTLEVLMNQGNGRPGESKPAEQSVVVERRVIYAGVRG